jgi:uncharacterized membrane protein YjgN (DUF898 family)
MNATVGPTGLETPGVPASMAGVFHGRGGTLFGIHIVNVLFMILTLGVYYFWAKVRVRGYLWSQTEFLDDRFAFHGTGRELLLGWLRAALVFGVPAVGLSLLQEWPTVDPLVQGAAGLLLLVLGAVFLPIATVGARRYRLSRTSWRGIRFSFRGRALAFVRLFLLGTLLSLLTLGLYAPFFEAQRQGFLVGHSRFGTWSFGFDGRGGELFWLYLQGLVALTVIALLTFGLAIAIVGVALVSLLGAPPDQWQPGLLAEAGLVAVPVALVGLLALGIAWAWFSAKRHRYLWSHTTFGNARFRSTMLGWPLFLLRLANLVLLVLTFGLAWPWTTVRTARFTVRNIQISGPLDLDTIAQDAELPSATGEGLADFLDVGFDLG